METLKPLLITFNCGRQLVNPEVFAHHLVNTLSKTTNPDIIILSLQEVSPIAYAFLGGSYLVPYFDRLHNAVDLAAKVWGNCFVSLITRHVGMTAIMAFVREDLSDRIRWMETGGVGVGLWEMGNKGAVGLRIGYAAGDQTMELTFVAAHLAPMEDMLERRNEDWMNTVRLLVFSPVDGKSKSPAAPANGARATTTPPLDEAEPLLSEPSRDDIHPTSGIYTPTSYLFLAGDLNYRTSSTKPNPSDTLLYPQPVPQDNPRHYSNLLQSDQLTTELKAHRTCHGLTEPPLDFPPTYKYSDRARHALEAHEAKLAASNHEGGDPNPDDHLDWAPHRWPSWCDRILYLDLPSWMMDQQLDAKIQVLEYKALPLMSSSDHRAVALLLSIPLLPIPPPDDEVAADDVRMHPPFPIDPHWRERRAAARRWELVVGVLAYLGLTWEGNGVLLAVVVGALGGWAVVRSMLEE